MLGKQWFGAGHRATAGRGGARGEERRREGGRALAEFQDTLLYWLSQLPVKLKNFIVISRSREAVDGGDDERRGVWPAESHKHVHRK